MSVMTPAPPTPPAGLGSALQQYRQRTENVEEYLGRVVFTSQRKVYIPFDDIKKVFDDAGLADVCPKVPNNIDVFRSVTTEATRSSVPVPGRDGVTLSVTVKQIYDGELELVRRLIVEELDKKGRRLTFSEGWDLIYDKTTGDVRRRPAPQVPRDDITHEPIIPEIATTVADEILADAVAHRGKVNAARLRTSISKVLERCHAIPLRATGGAHFVTRDESGPLERLIAAARNIPNCQVDVIKLTDEGDGVARDIVRGAAEEALMAQCRKLITEINELDGSEAGKRRKATLSGEFRRISSAIAAHERLLQETLGNAQMQFGLMQDALFAAVGTIEV